MTQTIEQLAARVRELEEENARLKKVTHVSLPTNTMEQWVASEVRKATSRIKAQLAAEQLNNKLLRDALDDTFSFLERHSNRWDGINGKHPQAVAEAAREALDTTISTEALDAYVAEKVKEWRNAYEKSAEAAMLLSFKVDELARQRDLAVEAIRHCIAAMGSVTDVKKAMDWPQLHNAQMLSLQALDDIKESDGK